ncbi:MAG: hypothetical protein SOX31_04145 [Eubacteriales bacterium]|nr:hypothetical protein [Eubacteriales bacterium]
MKRRWYAAALLLPALFPVTVISAFVILNTFREGLGFLPELSMYALDLSNYAALFGNRVFLRSLAYSFYVAFVSTTICFLLGLALAYLLCRTKSAAALVLSRLPVVLSYIAAGLLLYTTLSDHGLLYHLLRLLRIETDGLPILFRPSGMGVMILNCFKGVPFFAMSMVPVLAKVLKRYSTAAMNLGASGRQIGLRIIFPLIRRSAFTSALVLFNYQMFAYESFYYLGASTPVSLGVFAYQSYQTSDLRDRAVCMAINAVMIGIALITSLLYMGAMRKDTVMKDAS